MARQLKVKQTLSQNGFFFLFFFFFFFCVC